jgi:hypothetical protein
MGGLDEHGTVRGDKVAKQLNGNRPMDRVVIDPDGPCVAAEPGEILDDQVYNFVKRTIERNGRVTAFCKAFINVTDVYNGQIVV